VRRVSHWVVEMVESKAARWDGQTVASTAARRADCSALLKAGHLAVRSAVPMVLKTAGLKVSHSVGMMEPLSVGHWDE